jgi:predicted Zn-dependent protease
VLGVGSQIGGSLYLLKFGRDQESEADRLGIRYMADNGWNPVGMMEVMQILKEASGGGAGWEILSTHPNPEARYNDAEKLIKEQYPDFHDTSKYRMGQDRFQQIVVTNLARLPKPKHGGKAAAAPTVPLKAAGADVTHAKRSALDRAMARMHELGNCVCHVPAPVPQAVIDAQDRR